MKAESLMWRALRPILVAARLDPVRVENPIHPGTPDVNLVGGHWVELKHISGWPARDRSLVQIRHYTPQQRVWLFRRWKYAPGTTYLLLQVRDAKLWLLFDGDVAAKIVGRSTEEQHRQGARVILADHQLSELPRVLAETARTCRKLLPDPPAQEPVEP